MRRARSSDTIAALSSGVKHLLRAGRMICSSSLKWMRNSFSRVDAAPASVSRNVESASGEDFSFSHV